MLILSLFVAFLVLVLIVFMWLIGDMSFRAKIILTLMYIASFAFLAWPGYNFLMVVSHVLLAIGIGGAVFGLDFLTRRH